MIQIFSPIIFFDQMIQCIIILQCHADHHVIDDLKENPDILGFVNKDLSRGFYSNELTKIFDDHALGLYDMFMQGVRDESITLKNPDITFFMIVELVGSTCYSCIMKQVPCDIDTYKPYLYATIKQLMHESKK